jgi:hypothetical protein
MPDEQRKPGYLDDNLGREEKESRRTRIPSPEQEGSGEGKDGERAPMNPDRPDEFGDGDRRS